MSQKREYLPKPAFQVPPNNRLEKEVKQIVSSFNLPLRLFLFSKYNVLDNHIYPNQNKYQLLLSFSRIVFFNLMCFHRMYAVLDVINARKKNITITDSLVFWFLLIMFTIIHSFSFTMLFILDIIHKKNNVILILKIQTIYKSIDFGTSVRSYIIWNWISIFITVCVNVTVFVGFYTTMYYKSVVTLILDAYTDFSFVVFDINLIIAIRITILLRKYIYEWIKHVLMINYENNQRCQKLIEIYQNVLEVFSLFKSIFQLLVSS